MRPLLAAVGAPLFALLLRSATLHGQALEDFDYEDLEFRGIGLEAGWVWPSREAPTSVYGLRADLGFVGPQVRISPAARFWSSSLRSGEVERLAKQIVQVCRRQPGVTCPAELDLGQVRLSDLELATDAQYIFLPQAPINPFVGLTAALHLLNGRGDFIDGTFVEDLLDTVAPGIGTAMGVLVPIGANVQLSVEGRLMLGSDVRYASLSAGGLWNLPAPGPGAATAMRGGRR